MVSKVHVNIPVPPPSTCPVPYNKYLEHNDGHARGRAWSPLGLMDMLLGKKKENRTWVCCPQKSATPNYLWVFMILVTLGPCS